MFTCPYRSLSLSLSLSHTHTHTHVQHLALLGISESSWFFSMQGLSSYTDLSKGQTRSKRQNWGLLSSKIWFITKLALLYEHPFSVAIQYMCPVWTQWTVSNKRSSCENLSNSKEVEHIGRIEWNYIRHSMHDGKELLNQRYMLCVSVQILCACVWFDTVGRNCASRFLLSAQAQCSVSHGFALVPLSY